MARVVVDKNNPHSGAITLDGNASLLVVQGLRKLTLRVDGADATWARAVGAAASTADGGSMPSKTDPVKVGDLLVLESHGPVPYLWTILLSGTGATAYANAER